TPGSTRSPPSAPNSRRPLVSNTRPESPMFSYLKLALRRLAKEPGFTATVIVVLALGIGATTAIFTVINAVLLHPFPYQDGNHILFIGSSRLDHPNSQMPVAYPDSRDWRRTGVHSVEHLGF